MTEALSARAVEPRAGEAHGDADGGLCLNCGTRLIGEHCHRCGQAGHVHRTVGAIGHELAHGVFHFEGKIWRTLPMLTFRPGELTRRYVAGERARFVSPLALFLFTVFLMFAVVANLPGFTFGGDGLARIGERNGVTEVRAKVAEERLRADAAVGKAKADLHRARAETTYDADRVPRAERALVKAREDRDGLTSVQRLFPAPDAPSATAGSGTGGWLNAKWKYATENPKLLLYKMKTSA